jgi:acyl-coenzyme A thioesterase PaaI-like protein
LRLRVLHLPPGLERVGACESLRSRSLAHGFVLAERPTARRATVDGAMMVTMLDVVMMAGEMMRGVAMRMTVRERRLTECDREKCKNASTHTSAPFIIS